jgi:outer membrane lipoprotein-sorting protein
MLKRTALLFLLAAFSAAHAAADEPPKDAEPQHAALKGRIQDLLDTVKTATWSQDIWLTNGKREEENAAEAFWKGQELIRLNVSKGRGRNNAVILRDGTVTGFRPGALSFARLSFDVNDRRALSVRGISMESTGFIVDLELIVKQWDDVKITLRDDEAVIDYTSDQALPARMWLSLPELHPHKIEITENGDVVERHHYTDIRYNAELPEGIFEP